MTICEILVWDTPVSNIEVTTDSTAMARISSTMAAPKINLPSFDCILFISLSTRTEIAMLVAVNAVAMTNTSISSKPKNKRKTKYPPKKGIITLSEPTVNEAAPFLKNSFGVISIPAIKRITIAEISPTCFITSLTTINGWSWK